MLVATETGDMVQIDQGNLVRNGSDIEVYNFNSGNVEVYEVQSVRSSGGGAEVEVYDYNSGKSDGG